jgi:hypothetical protein
MTFGSMIHADRRLRQYESQIMAQRRVLREKAKWEQYEEELSKNLNK